MVRVTGYYYGRKFDVTVSEKCYETILNTKGVAIWSEEYL